jgi:hypothetical protein
LKTSSELPDGKSFLAFSIKLGKLWRIMENPWNIASLASIHNPRLAFRPGRLHDSQERDRCKDLLSLQSKEIATLKARHNDGPDISAFLFSARGSHGWIGIGEESLGIFSPDDHQMLIYFGD